MTEPAFKRILLKLSGEALMGELPYGTDLERVQSIAREIRQRRSDRRERRHEVVAVEDVRVGRDGARHQLLAKALHHLEPHGHDPQFV